MTLAAYRDAVVLGLKASIPAFRAVEPHGGRFDLEELRRFGAAAPAARVALTAVGPIKDMNTGRLFATARCAVFVVTRDAPAVPRDQAALTLVGAVLTLAQGNVWGDAAAQEPTGMRAENLFSSGTDKTGVALWAVVWNQAIELGGLDADALDDLELIAQSWNVGGPESPDPQDEISLPQE